MTLEAAIVERARELTFELDAAAIERLVLHAQCMLDENEYLHLTTLTDARSIAIRHVGESLEGAAWLRAELGDAFRLIDLGSGNGYPGLAIAAALPKVRATLADASPAKAAFLSRAVERLELEGVDVLGQVQRPGDLPDADPYDAIVTRAMGGWAKIVPRLAESLRAGGVALLWAGDDAASITRRSDWSRRFEALGQRPLSGRDRSWLWAFRRAASAES